MAVLEGLGGRGGGGAGGGVVIRRGDKRMRLLWERYVGAFLPYPSAPAPPPQLAHQGGGEPSQQPSERLQHPIARSLLSRSFRPGRVPLRQTPATLLTDMPENTLAARSSGSPPPVGHSPFPSLVRTQQDHHPWCIWIEPVQPIPPPRDPGTPHITHEHVHPRLRP